MLYYIYSSKELLDIFIEICIQNFRERVSSYEDLFRVKQSERTLDRCSSDIAVKILEQIGKNELVRTEVVKDDIVLLAIAIKPGKSTENSDRR